jgi:cytosine/uracil/thiamine/allantoin permease
MVLGCLIACGIGELIGLSVSNPNNANSLMFNAVPHILIIPIVLIGLIGNASNGGMVAYNGMLDLQAILWKLKRVQVGLVFSVIGLVVGYVGLIAYNMTNSILALCSIVTVLVTPWTVINVIGYLRHGRQFRPADLQAFASGGGHGMYWYKNGFNIPAVAAWVVSIVIGMMFSDTAIYVGPLSQAAKGVDLSFLSAAFVGGILYLILDQLFPSAAKIRGDHAVSAIETV